MNDLHQPFDARDQLHAAGKDILGGAGYGCSGLQPLGSELPVAHLGAYGELQIAPMDRRHVQPLPHRTLRHHAARNGVTGDHRLCALPRGCDSQGLDVASEIPVQFHVGQVNESLDEEALVIV